MQINGRIFTQNSRFAQGTKDENRLAWSGAKRGDLDGIVSLTMDVAEYLSTMYGRIALLLYRATLCAGALFNV